MRNLSPDTECNPNAVTRSHLPMSNQFQAAEGFKAKTDQAKDQLLQFPATLTFSAAALTMAWLVALFQTEWGLKAGTENQLLPLTKLVLCQGKQQHPKTTSAEPL